MDEKGCWDISQRHRVHRDRVSGFGKEKLKNSLCVPGVFVVQEFFYRPRKTLILSPSKMKERKVS